jgi:hypothetical protein
MYCATNRFLQQWIPAVHGVMGCGQKSFKLVWGSHQLLSGFLANGNLPRLSRQSRLSANHKGDNEIIPGAVHRPPSICLKAEKNPEKHRLGDRHEDCVIRNRKGRKEGKYGVQIDWLRRVVGKDLTEQYKRIEICGGACFWGRRIPTVLQKVLNKIKWPWECFIIT